MNPYSSLCDDFYVNMNLGTEMELPTNRETVLHFFERIQKTYPTMRNFYCRDRGDFILEEDKDQEATAGARSSRGESVQAKSTRTMSSTHWTSTNWSWNSHLIPCRSARWTVKRSTCSTASISPIGEIIINCWSSARGQSIHGADCRDSRRDNH